jgi:flagellar hook-length control protein FliK
MSAVRATPLAADATKAPGLRATPAASLDGAFAIQLLSASAPATPVATPAGLAATPAPSPAPVSPLPPATQLVPPVPDPGESVAPAVPAVPTAPALPAQTVVPAAPTLDLGKPAPILPIDPPTPAAEDDAHKTDDTAQADVAALVGLPIAPPIVQAPVEPPAPAVAAPVAPAAAPVAKAAAPAVAPPVVAPAPRGPVVAPTRDAADGTDAPAPTVISQAGAPVATPPIAVPVAARETGAASTAPVGSSTARVRVQRPTTDPSVPETKMAARAQDVNPLPTIAPSLVTQQAAPVAQVSTAAATTPLAAQIAKPILTLQGSPAGTHILTIKIAPDSLGPVTVRAHLGGDGIRIELIAPTDQGRDAINAILPDLKRDLAQGGMQQTSLDVSTQSSGGGAFSENQNSPSTGGASDQGARRDSWSARGESSRADQQGPIRTAAVGGTSLLDVYA